MRLVLALVLGFLSGIVGMLAGWAAFAFGFVALAGTDREGAIAMAAFASVGPIGAVIGFGVGVFLFVKFGLVAHPAAPQPAVPGAAAPAAGAPTAGPAAVAPTARHISRPYAVVLLAIVGGLAWWGWFEFIRSPYLTHGDMDLALQFKLPEGVAIPSEPEKVKILLDEDGRFWPGRLNAGWHGHQGTRVVLLATASMSYKASRRTITLSMPGMPDQSWPIDLPSDPDPTPGYTAWAPSSNAPDAIELNWKLNAEH